MCDTVGRIINDKYAIFGKNSDRAVNEAQVVEFYNAKDYKNNEEVRCTYISIPQVKHTNAIVLSRPTWLWGGEIGVNEYGVCIGNEAVFTKGKYGKQSLIGMDLLRLALERGSTAKECMDIIIDLLQTYGQGGNCGYDSKFEYNNSFLIMDRKEIYILETVGKNYVYKKSDHYSISNRLTINEDGDYYSEGKCNFARKHSDFIMTLGACGKNRRCMTYNHKLDNLEDMMDLLSAHDRKAEPFTKGTVSSVCMHASSSLTADQSSMSMIVELREDDIDIYITGCSLPCISVFKPHKFKEGGLIFKYEEGNDKYWKEHELFNRRFIGHEIPLEYEDEKNKLQEEVLRNGADKIEKSLKLEREFVEKYSKIELKEKPTGLLFKSFWNKKNKEFMK